MKSLPQQTQANVVLLELLTEYFHSAILGANAKIIRARFIGELAMSVEIDLMLEDEKKRFSIDCRYRRTPQVLPLTVLFSGTTYMYA